jgi:hypothetical protein
MDISAEAVISPLGVLMFVAVPLFAEQNCHQPKDLAAQPQADQGRPPDQRCSHSPATAETVLPRVWTACLGCCHCTRPVGQVAPAHESKPLADGYFPSLEPLC